MAFVKPTPYQKTPGKIHFAVECPGCLNSFDVNFADEVITCPVCLESIYLITGAELE